MQDSYLTLATTAEGEFKDRGSKFLAYANAVHAENEVKDFLAKIRKMHPKARHHCYAYRLGLDGNDFRANDDGEPSGTAGRPILGQIDSFGLTNVLIVVVRYFGGTKLGVSGLINAYKLSAADALEHGKIEEKIIQNVYSVAFDYGIMSDIMGFLKQKNIDILGQDFQAQPVLTIGIRKKDAKDVLQALEDKVNPYGQMEVSPVKVEFLREK